MELPSLEEEATMSEPYYVRESYYPGEYENEPDDRWYPDPEDSDDEHYERLRDLAEEFHADAAFYAEQDEDNPVETDDPYDERGWR